jgi:beta-galactosidase GanA
MSHARPILLPNHGGRRGIGWHRFVGTLVAVGMATAASAEAPSLHRQGSATQLMVSGKPMLLLAGELGNSSASSAAYMEPHWAKLRAMHLNTVLASVSWELIEPEEGKYDWSSVDSLIRSARAHDLKLVLLWFGAWKNSMSTYVPAWVKRDQARFPRAQTPDGQGVDILSAFAPETLRADARAYAALMAHLKAVDDKANTVVMVQVENEIGMLPVARDYGPLATAAFRQAVPQPLIDYLVAHRDKLVPEMQRMWLERGAKTRGSWEELFGPGDAAAEVFTAWYYARFADQLAAAGKAAYPIPMYVNVALNRPGRVPGEYPSGGPLPHLLDVWKAGTPSIDLIAPDIYFSSFVDIVNRYRRPDNPLFVPESVPPERPEAMANAFYAFGKTDAIGFSPFSIESSDEKPGALANAYDVLDQLTPAILAAQGLGRMSAFKPRALYDETVIYEPVTERIGNYRFTVSFADIQRPTATADTVGYGGIIIQVGPEDYLIAGRGIVVTFEPVGDGPPHAGIDSAWEGIFDAGGRWVPGRLLNGDQTHQGRHIRLAPGAFGIQRVRLYRYR